MKGAGAAHQHPEPGGLQPQLSHDGKEPSRGAGLTGRQKPTLARSPGSRHHHSMASSPSAAFLRLRTYIAERMRMSHIYQPLMLLELLGRSSPAPAQDVARRILGSGWWARFTFNGIIAYGNCAYSLIGSDELSDGERDELLELCRQRLDAIREQRGEEVFAHRSRHRSPNSGSVKYKVLHRARGRCECCVAHEHKRALKVDHIIPRNQGGSDAISNLQALCFRGV